jgi:small-conductance mechanosensitive channel
MEILGIDFGQFDLNAWLSEAWQFAGPKLAQSLGILALATIIYWIGIRILRRIERRVVTRTATVYDDLLVRMARRGFQISVFFWAAWRVAAIWTLAGQARFIAAMWIVALSIPISGFLGGVIFEIEQRLAPQTNTTLDDTALPMLNKVLRFVVVGVGVLIALEYMGINIAPLLAGAGVVGLALSLAAKDTLSNLIAGVLLILDRPFQVGDRIELWNAPKETGTWGDVVEIGLRATKIRNPDNLIVVVPNNEIMRRDIINYTASGSHIRLRIPMTIAYDSNEPLAKKLLLQAAEETEGVKMDPAPVVIVRSFGPSEVNLQLRVWIDDARRRRAVADLITARVRELFQENGIEIPYPKRDLYIRNAPDNTLTKAGDDAGKDDRHEERS